MIGISILLIIFLFIVASPQLQTVEEPINVGRYRIVSEPSGIVLKIDTHDGQTFRLVRNAQTGGYSWEDVNKLGY